MPASPVSRETCSVSGHFERSPPLLHPLDLPHLLTKMPNTFFPISTLSPAKNMHPHKFSSLLFSLHLFNIKHLGRKSVYKIQQCCVYHLPLTALLEQCSPVTMESTIQAALLKTQGITWERCYNADSVHEVGDEAWDSALPTSSQVMPQCWFTWNART